VRGKIVISSPMTVPIVQQVILPVLCLRVFDSYNSGEYIAGYQVASLYSTLILYFQQKKNINLNKRISTTKRD